MTKKDFEELEFEELDPDEIDEVAGGCHCGGGGQKGQGFGWDGGGYNKFAALAWYNYLHGPQGGNALALIQSLQNGRQLAGRRGGGSGRRG